MAVKAAQKPVSYKVGSLIFVDKNGDGIFNASKDAITNVKGKPLAVDSKEVKEFMKKYHLPKLEGIKLYFKRFSTGHIDRPFNSFNIRELGVKIIFPSPLGCVDTCGWRKPQKQGEITLGNKPNPAHHFPIMSVKIEF